MVHESSSKSLTNADRTSKRLHRLVCDREVWVWLLRGIDNFSKEKVEELARFGSNGSPEMKAEVVKAAANKMVPSDNRYRVNVKVSVKGWGDTPDSFEVDGDSIGEAVQQLTMEERSGKLTLTRVQAVQRLTMEDRLGNLSLTRVALTVGAIFTIKEVHCSKSISDSSTASILSGIAKHVKRQADKMESLDLVGLPRKCTPLGRRKELFFALLKLSKKWKIVYLDWFPHGSYLSGLSGQGDTNTSTGQFHLKTLSYDNYNVSATSFLQTHSILVTPN